MLFELLAASARRAPDACALVLPDGRTMSYAMLLQRVEWLAAELTASGVERGRAVMLVLPNTVDFVTTVFAVARCGAVGLPLTPQFPAAELSSYARDVAPVAVVTTAQHSRLCEQAILAAGLRCPVIDPGPLRSRNAIGPACAVAGTDPALIQYSSGSTGLPKRVVRTHANLVAEAKQFVATVHVTRTDRILTVVPLFHAHGFGNCLLAAVYAGASLVLLDAFERARVIEAMQRKEVTIFPGVPFMFGILASSPSILPTSFPSLRLAFSAGAPLPHEVFDGFRSKFGVELRQLYGSTETGSVSINLGSCDGNGWASVGQPMQGVELRIVDPWGRDVPDGQVGEILIRSAAMATRYDQSDDASGQAFRDGYYWSSDLGYRAENGNVFITGRTTIFIDTGGHKVDPIEVEQVIARHPKVAQCVVLGVRGRYGRQLIKAVIVAREPCSSDEIALWCQGTLADFKIPRLIEFRREIPTNPLGKILRKYLH